MEAVDVVEQPSYVSPTTGSDQTATPDAATDAATIASRTTPTLCVLVIATGGQQAGLADPLEPGQLAVAVQAVAAGEDRLGEPGRAGRRP